MRLLSTSNLGKMTLGPEGPQSHFSRTVHSDCLTCACAKTFWGGGRRRKTLRNTSLWRFRHLGQPEPTGAISVTENVSEPRFCMVMYFSSKLRRNYVSGRWEIFKNRKQPKIGHFGPFSGSQRLIFTHPTSQWSYIMPLGSDTSVGTFPGIRNHSNDSFRAYFGPSAPGPTGLYEALGGPFSNPVSLE